MDQRLLTDLKASIRSIPDYPKPGVVFRDITTLLGDARAFRRAVDELVHPFAGGRIDKVAGIEARGFILGGAVAHQLSAGFVPIRKKGKLPHETVRIAYSLEYGVDEMEIHTDAIGQGERVILVDDLIATGGTAVAATRLLRQIGADIVAACFIIDLPDLGGAQKLRDLGVDEMEIHTDAIGQEERVILIDDLIATGGTAIAATNLLRQIGANIVAACFIIDLPDLGGAQKLRELDVDVRTLMSFEGH